MQSLVDWANDNAGSLNVLFAAVVAAATVVTVFLNRRLVNETVALRKAETDPDIALYIEPRTVYRSWFDLVIRNVGRGPAYSVVFDIEPKARPGGESHLWDLALVRDGLKYLAPNQDLRTFVGTYHDLDFGPVVITVRYLSKPKVWRRSRFEEDFTIDVRQFAGMVAVGDPPETQVIRQLKRIADDFHWLRMRSWSVPVRIERLRLTEEQGIPIGSEQTRSGRIAGALRRLRWSVRQRLGLPWVHRDPGETGNEVGEGAE